VSDFSHWIWFEILWTNERKNRIFLSFINGRARLNHKVHSHWIHFYVFLRKSELYFLMDPEQRCLLTQYKNDGWRKLFNFLYKLSIYQIKAKSIFSKKGGFIIEKNQSVCISKTLQVKIVKIVGTKWNLNGVMWFTMCCQSDYLLTLDLNFWEIDPFVSILFQWRNLLLITHQTKETLITKVLHNS
jgi:hypothetical protein